MKDPYTLDLIASITYYIIEAYAAWYIVKTVKGAIWAYRRVL